jgi:murein DD-endopeptidase MepM/ murein hydrolase activator NlpD
LKKIILLLLILAFAACKDEKTPLEFVEILEPEIIIEYGYKLNDFKVIHDTIRKGDIFSDLLTRHHVDYAKVLEIVSKIRDTFNVRTIKSGIPYTILAKNDSTEQAQVFIYKHSRVRYTVIDFKDSIFAFNAQIPVKTVLETASGVITSNLSDSMDEQGLSPYLTYKMADDIFAWAIDFTTLQKNDKYKLIYEQLYIHDTIPVGIGEVKAAYFEHVKKQYYAFKFLADSTLGVSDYYDEEANNLRRQFLKMPIKFSHITSRYNLNRRIAFYGNQVRAHKGTDYAGAIGTPIMTTANGTVIESQYKGANGNYVKIRHNATYTTQYLHMSKRAVKVGQTVKQGDVIGYVGMTGNTSGPHVCYRFWKNGKQVDPLKENLPTSEPLKEALKPAYFEFIQPLKVQIDAVQYDTNNNSISEVEVELNS